MALPPLHEAASVGALVSLRELLACGVDDVDARDGSGRGRTALHWAALNGRTACLKALLAAGASLRSTDVYGFTALHLASAHGYAKCVRALLAAGAHVNRANVAGRTPFTSALCYGRCRVLKILLRAGADVRTETGTRNNDNSSAWALVDEIRAAGGWQKYVTRRRATLVRAISDGFRGKFPEVIYAEIAPYMEAPGGDDD